MSFTNMTTGLLRIRQTISLSAINLIL